MLELTDYTHYDGDTIIIHSHVGKLIDFNLINENFNKIIFSDYNDVGICVETK